MNIIFKAIGLEFEAEVDYTPLVPGFTYGPPEMCYPDEGGECEITELKCDGNDALFLRGSTVWEEIEIAAAEAAEATAREFDEY